MFYIYGTKSFESKGLDSANKDRTKIPKQNANLHIMTKKINPIEDTRADTDTMFTSPTGCIMVNHIFKNAPTLSYRQKIVQKYKSSEMCSRSGFDNEKIKVNCVV